MDKKQVINIVHSYKDAISPIFGNAMVYLYGSYTKGTAHEGSDIDVAVLVPHVEDDWWDKSAQLWKATRAVSDLIEPVLIDTSRPSPLYDDVIRTGISV